MIVVEISFSRFVLLYFSSDKEGRTSIHLEGMSTAWELKQGANLSEARLQPSPSEIDAFLLVFMADGSTFCTMQARWSGSAYSYSGLLHYIITLHCISIFEFREYNIIINRPRCPCCCCALITLAGASEPAGIRHFWFSGFTIYYWPSTCRLRWPDMCW